MPLKVLKQDRVINYLQRQPHPVVVIFFGTDPISNAITEELKEGERVWIGVKINDRLSTTFGILKIPCAIRFNKGIPSTVRWSGDKLLKEFNNGNGSN